jgi:hypothetical protein
MRRIDLRLRNQLRLRMRNLLRAGLRLRQLLRAGLRLQQLLRTLLWLRQRLLRERMPIRGPMFPWLLRNERALVPVPRLRWLRLWKQLRLRRVLRTGLRLRQLRRTVRLRLLLWEQLLLTQMLREEVRLLPRLLGIGRRLQPLLQPVQRLQGRSVLERMAQRPAVLPRSVQLLRRLYGPRRLRRLRLQRLLQRCLRMRRLLHAEPDWPEWCGLREKHSG